ncbi:MAG: winged helix-turn-helix domain-containing protein, partial [Planctomyces sp.]
QRVLNRSRGFVQRWAYAYRDGGIEALKDKPRGGSVGKISGQNAVRLMARIDAGPTAADKVCTLRGKDVQRIARDELGTDVSLTSVYRLLHKMGYSCLAPRPRHEKQDPAAQEKFKIDSAPLLSGPSATRSHLLAGPAESSSWTKPASASRAR